LSNLKIYLQLVDLPCFMCFNISKILKIKLIVKIKK